MCTLFNHRSICGQELIPTACSFLVSQGWGTTLNDLGVERNPRFVFCCGASQGGACVELRPPWHHLRLLPVPPAGRRCQNVCLGGGGVRAGGDFVLLQSMKGQAASGLFRSAFIHLSPTLGARHRQSWGRGHGGAVGFGFKTKRRPRKRGSVWLRYRAKYEHPKRSLPCQFRPALQATGPHFQPQAFKDILVTFLEHSICKSPSSERENKVREMSER